MATKQKASTRSVEKHLIDFLKLHPGPVFLSYRRRCLSFWLDEYGEVVVERVKAALIKEWGNER